MADLFVEVSAVGIQGLSGPGAGGYGATGSTGPAGATGPGGGSQGASGSTGSQGIQGTSGVGASGVQGASGIAGASGVGAGGSGATGSTGAQGIQGSSGVAGSTGIAGASGVGATGIQGTSGISGASGYIGRDGASGIAGSTGVAGSSGANGTSVKIVGAVLTPGDLNPAYTGAIGDGFVSTDSGHLWIWNGTDWTDVGNITGPAGATGVRGATGIRGASGVTGASGASGISGASGYIGLDGATGIRGASGIQGASGASGISGATGAGLTTTIFTTSSTNEVVVESINAASYRSAKYDMQITSADNYMATEFRVLIDNPNIFMTEYGAIGDYLGTFATYYSPLSNDYSSEINNGGLSVHNNTTVTIYTTNNNVIQGLLSIPSGTTLNLNNSVNVTLSSKFTEADAGIYVATVAQNRYPPLMITRIKWTGTGEVELRFTPTYANSTLKYNRVLIEL